MNKLLALLLVVLCGCNTSSEDNAEPNSRDVDSPAVNDREVTRMIFAVPRPNSGKFSSEEALALLPQFLERSIPTLKTNTIVTTWESPTQGIRVHVTVDDTVEVIDYLGRSIRVRGTCFDGLGWTSEMVWLIGRQSQANNGGTRSGEIRRV